MKAKGKSADNVYNEGVDLVNSLLHLDDLITFDPKEIEDKYFKVLAFINKAADKYSESGEHDNVISTYKELANICEKFIADTLVQLAEYKHENNSTSEAIQYYELAYYFYEEAIKLEKYVTVTIDIHDKALAALHSLESIDPGSADEYKIKVLSHLRKYNITEKPKHELISYSPLTLEYIEQQAKAREDAKKQAFANAKMISYSPPTFIRSFEDAAMYFSLDMDTELTSNVLGQLLFNLGKISTTVYPTLKSANDFYKLAATFGNSNAAQHMVALCDLLPQQASIRNTLFGPNYAYDRSLSQLEERRVAARDYNDYFMDVLCKHISNVHMACDNQAKNILADTFYRLGMKIFDGGINGLSPKRGRTLINEASKWQHAEAITMVSGFNACRRNRP